MRKIFRKVLWLSSGEMLIVLLPAILLANSIILESDSLKVEVDINNGCFTVTEKITGQRWLPDPWEHAAAILRVRSASGDEELWNLSRCREIDVSKHGHLGVRMTFKGPITSSGMVAPDVFVKTEIRLSSHSADMELLVLDFAGSQDYTLTEMEFPVRHFSLLTGMDRGMAAIPYFQGVVIPSYHFPMRNSKFATWDDIQHGQYSIGEFALHSWSGLSMPWFGICSDKSAVISIIPEDKSVRMQYILNYNDKDRINRIAGKESPFPRILALTPIWTLESIFDQQDGQIWETASNKTGKGKTVHYHFIPNGNHVSMAKYYRKITKQRGLFVSLREKAGKVPDVEKLRGDIYLHVYGGYPHYVNFPGMAFTFSELHEIITDLHDNLGVKKAFLTVWGTWENYPPYHWPINEASGGAAKLKQVFDLAKSYGYLITPYHTWHAILEHDPNYDASLLPRRSDGRNLIRGRWSAVDRKHWKRIAQEVLSKELPTIGSNATYSDGHQTIELLEYLDSLGLPMTMERVGDSEVFIPYFHRFEGLAPFNFKDPRLTFIEAPLFNLVYHDAVLTTNRWQSPDNDYDLNGDHVVRALRNMLVGNETMFVVPPWEYPGIRDQIRNAVKLMTPLHEKTAFEELQDHQFLSNDFLVQSSRFGNGTEVTVNMGLVKQSLPDGTQIPGLGYRIQHANGKLSTGHFKTVLVEDN